MFVSLMSICLWLQACGGGNEDASPYGSGSESATVRLAGTASNDTAAAGVNVSEGTAKALALPAFVLERLAGRQPERTQADARAAVQGAPVAPVASATVPPADAEVTVESCESNVQNTLAADQGITSIANANANTSFSAACLALMSALAPVTVSAQLTAPTATYSLPGGTVVQVAGQAASAGPSAAWPGRGIGRIYYVDSALGDDSSTGLAARALRGHGPWRSLARLATQRLSPGDMVILACGSSWNDTLRLASSGSATQPITVTAASGCQTPPVIDGSVAIAPGAWQRVSATVFRTTLNREPEQIFASTGTFLEAHHPNSTRTDSNEWTGWAALPNNGNVVVTKDGTGSQQVTLGSEIALPAGGRLEAGMVARFRTHSWSIDEVEVSSVAGNTLNFASPTTYPLEASIGYYLMGRAWMVDSPGEWHYDSRTAQLSAWMPDSYAPITTVYATTLAVGLDLSGRQFVIVNGLTVRRVGTGASLRGSHTVEIRNSRFEDITHRGVDASNSRIARFVANTFARTGLDAIAGYVPGQAVALAMTIQNNMITESGVLVRGERVIGPPRNTLAAVYGVPNSIITGNTLVNSGYIGIRAMGSSKVENNVVLRSCLVLDDCGGIYLWNDRDSQILNNVVAGARGPLAGKHEREPFSAAQGVYLDEAATNILIKGNITFDNDHGVLLHVSSNNQVFDNFVYGNRRSQMWLQASRARFIATGDMVNNHIRGNFFGAFGDAGALTLDNEFGSVTGLARIEGNMAQSTHANPVRLISNANRQTLNWRAWSALFNPPIEGIQPTVETPTTSYTVSGVNLVPNPGYANAAAGWGTWNQTPPFARIQDLPCPTGRCLRITAGASPTLVSSPNFSVQKDQWLRLSLDIFKSTNEPLNLALRRGGGGNNGYESLTSEKLTLNAASGWSRHHFVVQANATVLFRDSRTGDLGARMDVEGIAANSVVMVGNFEAVPVTLSVAASASAMVVNAGNAAQVMNCPLATSQQSFCTGLRRLSDKSLVTWPLQVAPYSAVVLYGQDPSLSDTDGDGIADRLDSCPGTARLAAVNSRGCAYGQV